MREIRLYQNENFNLGQIKLNQRNYNYLIKVLRFNTGKVTLFNGDGYNYTANIKRDGKNLIADITDKEINNTESKFNITLIQGIAKGDKMDYIMQKATELGVNTIIPLITKRVVVKLDNNKKQKKLQHWQEIAINAAEQCNRSVVPVIKDIINFNEIFDNKFSNAFVLDHRASKSLDKFKLQGEATILIGPEGGLDKEETAMAVNNNFQPLLLGSRVLRTETASLAAIANLQLLFGS